MIPKFRAWDKVFKEMVQVNALVLDEQVVKVTYKNGNVAKEDMKEYELMQSTGFEDNLGDVVFEGDIILWTYWDGFEDSGRAKIVFDKGMFKLLDICTEKEVWDNLFDCNENCDIYIQGNIYENPELLEVEE